MYTEDCDLEMWAGERYENKCYDALNLAPLHLWWGIMGKPLEATSADYYRNIVSYDWSFGLWKWLARRKEFSSY